MKMDETKKKKVKKFLTLESDNSWKLLYYPGRYILLILTIVPTFLALGLSMFSYNLAKPKQTHFIFLKNYLDVLTDKRFWNSFRVTLIFTVVSLAVEMIIGMAVALCMMKRIVGKNIVMILMLLPMMVTPVVVGLIWKMFYDPSFGTLTYYFKQLTGKSLNMLGDSSVALLALIIVDIWEWTPYVALILYSGLSAMPVEPFEAAAVDGADSFQIFRYITVPLLKNSIIISAVFRFMDLFKWMDTIYIMTGGGPGTSTETMSYYAYMNNFKFLNVGYASAICIIMLAIILTISNTFGKRIFFGDENNA